MSPDRNDFDLAAELLALRPVPQPQFSAELDARVAAGFPRRQGAASPGSRVPGGFGRRAQGALGRLSDRLRIAPRRLIGPAAGVALATIAVAAVVVVSSEDATRLNLSKPSETESLGGVKRFGHVERFSGVVPQAATGSPARLRERSQNDAGVAAGASGPSRSSAQALNGAFDARGRTGPYASKAGRREVERSAELVLGTEAANVREATAKVFSTVHTYDGIVLRSSIEDGAAGEARAEFELLIPSAKLSDALASLSRIAEVRSRHEASADVTARTVGLGERLQDARARVRSLLSELAAADTAAERASAEAELRSERLRVAALRSRLSSLERRTNFSRLSLRIESGEGAAAAHGENSGWGLGDALSDAGHILEVAAGLTLLVLAILSPLALLGLLAWLSRRAWLRRSRERALT